jgi:hypothetical protein
MILKCKNEFCNEPAARDQVYCSWQHAPYGHLCNRNKSGGRPKTAAKNLETRDKIIECAKNGMTKSEASRLLGCGITTVRKYAKEWNIEFRDGGKGGSRIWQRYTEEELAGLYDNIRKLASEGKTATEAAGILDLPYAKLYKYTKIANIHFIDGRAIHSGRRKYV